MKIEVPCPLVEVETAPPETETVVGVTVLPVVAVGLVGGRGGSVLVEHQGVVDLYSKHVIILGIPCIILRKRIVHTCMYIDTPTHAHAHTHTHILYTHIN